MKVLVTGAGGYIGSVLVPTLLSKGFEVVALDRFFFGKGSLQHKENLTVVEEDIRTIDKSIFKGVSSVIDLAAISNDPAGELDPVKTVSINHLGRFRIASLAKAAKESGVDHYLLPSSCSIYGFQDGEVDETSKINPLTTYAVANYKAEHDIMNLADDDFCVTIIRQATVYGLSPRMRFDLAINGMVKGFFKNGKIPILRDGSQWRPFVHVRDTSRAMSMILKADKKLVNKELFNVGCNEQNYQIFNLAERVASSIGIPFQHEWYGAADNRSYKVNFDKIKEVLGFKPEYDAEKGAAEVWHALKTNLVNADDPTSITVEWYKKLLSDGVQI